MIAWALFVAFLFRWIGWHIFSSSFRHWSWARLAWELLILASAWDDHRRFRFPLIRLISAVVGWLFVIDLVTNGGNFTAAVTLVVGLAYLASGAARNAQPSAFWLHFVAGLLIGGSLLYWLHSGDVEWAFIGVFSVVYMAIGARLARSSWSVFGAFGLYLVATRYAAIWSQGPSHGIVKLGGGTGFGPAIRPSLPVPGISGFRPWAAIVTFAVLGFLYVALGILSSRRRSETV